MRYRRRRVQRPANGAAGVLDVRRHARLRRRHRHSGRGGFVRVWLRVVAALGWVRDDAGVRGPGRVGWAWLAAVSLCVVLGAGGFWIGGGLGAGIGAVAGGFTPLLIERATRRQEAAESAGRAEVPGRLFGPAHLLEPGLGVVPFTGRVDELAALEGWCLGERSGLVRLVTAGGGAGKTRLALELRARMIARGWRCVLIDEGAETDAAERERAAAPRAGLLLVVDYAETRPGLEGLLKAAARDEGRVRVLLLARHAGDWWQRLRAGAGAVRDAVAAASESVLPLAEDLGPGLGAEDEARRAVPFFAARLEIPVPDAGLVSVPDSEELRVLDLHAAALVAVLQYRERPAGARVGVDTAMVLEKLLDHEKHYWLGRADAAGLTGGADGLSVAELSQVAAAGCLLGAGMAEGLAGRVPGVTITGSVALWLRELYPLGPGGELGMLRPDRLAELHVSRELSASPALAEACLTRLDESQARRALVLLARASGEHPAARALLESAIARFPEAAGGLTGPREVMIAVADAIPHPSLALAPTHASLSAKITAAFAPGEPGRATWLNTHAVLLGDLGRREEALTAIEEAVTIRRALAQDRPDAFLPGLAASLNNLSIFLSDLGRREEALTAIEEAVTIYRALAQDRPDAFLPNLATALNNQSNRLWDLGRREEALTAIEEAVTICRALAQDRPDAFLPNLAMSLNNQSNALSDLGRREEALTAIEEAVTIRRALAQDRPDAFLPGFALSLNNLGGCLSDLGQREEALTAIEEAVTAYRALAQDRPDAFLPDLAMSLSNQSNALSDLGRREEALTAIEEAVTICRALAQDRPDAFLPRLAMSLNNQAAPLSGLGRREEALTAIEEAVTAYRALARDRPDAFLPNLASSLNDQSEYLSGLGRREEALTAIEEAVTIRRGLAQARPAVFGSSYANSLEAKAVILSALDRRSEAEAARQEAATIRGDD
jgi:tetratricopeptide (TPR) repeat protein